MAGLDFDYVIVGGGAAGCALAARLSEDPDTRVLLLEAGGRDRHPLIHMPVGFAKMTTGPFVWGYRTVPQRHAENREIPYAQGRVLGGGSSINAEIYTRGAPEDYDRWAAEEGCTGWSWEEVRPHFLRAEGNTAKSGPWHGTDGPLGVSDQVPQPVTRAFVQSCMELGMPPAPDFNAGVQRGAGIYQTTTRDGRRCSSAAAYLRPARGRANLTVLTGCAARRVTVEGGRATGVAFSRGKGAEHARAAREVVVAAGAIGSPKLMMLSGIGPADHLRGHGIDVVADLPGVGANLADHFGIDIVAELGGPWSLDRYNGLAGMAVAGLQYVLFGTGPVTSNVVEGGAFWRTDGAEAGPAELQFHFLAGAGAEAGVATVASGHGITLNSYTLRPRSRGTVRLASADPAAAPLIDPNYLAEPEDLRIAAEGVRISREIFRQKSLQKFIRRMHLPGEDVRTRADFEAYARRYGRTSYHPVGTCRMGTDAEAVLTPDLRVRGVEGLRVCDSSAMPSLIGSNTNAPTIMIAEKAAAMIRGNR